ncbi:MAG: alpha/beta fold hydrolase [Candidatus Geothermincolales bacterium]
MAPRLNNAAILGEREIALLEREVNRGLPPRCMFAPYTLPVEAFYLETPDGNLVHACRLGRDSDRAVILCHGFGGNKNIRNFVALAQFLSRLCTVYTFDFRGHGLSPGPSTFGVLEAMDLGAVVEEARARGASRLAAVGLSMGGVVIIRYAALHGKLDSLVVISAPADLWASRAPGARLIRLLLGTSLGRRLATLRYGVSLDGSWKKALQPIDLVPLVYPQPITIIHGEDDFVFEPRQAELLARRAPGNCRLHILPGFGHAEMGYGPALLSILLDTLNRDLGLDPWEAFYRRDR